MTDPNPDFLYYLPDGETPISQGTSGLGNSNSPTQTSLTADDINGMIATQLRTQTERMQLVTGTYQSQNFVSGSAGWQIDSLGNAEFNNGTFRGILTASAINIPNTTTANSFHVDTNGNAWWGATTLGSAKASVLNTGAATFTTGTIGGTTIGATTLVVGSGANAITIDSSAGTITGTGFSLNGNGTISGVVKYANSASSFSSASATQTVTHGLTIAPKSIKISAFAGNETTAGRAGVGNSNGAWDASGQSCSYETNSGTSNVAGASTTIAIIADGFYRAGATAVSYHGVIGNVTATTFDIVWTTVNPNASAAVTFSWIAEG